MKRNEDTLRDLWENIKGTNIHFSQREKRKAWKIYLKQL